MEQTQIGRRSRTYSWDDPMAGAVAVGQRSGLAVLQAMISGELAPPPVAKLLDMARFEAEEGRVVVEIVPQEFHYNPLGTVHGGVLSTVLDTAAGCAVHSTLPAGVGYTTLELSTRFMRPVTTRTGRLRCEGTVLTKGGRTAVAEARLTDPAGRMVAHATTTCLLIQLDGQA